MTTTEAFTQLINTRGMSTQLGVKRTTWGRMKTDFLKGTAKVSLDKQIELLQKAGFEVVQEMKWGNPPK
jgi:uncharacterized membrane protein (DUF2068 family)